MGRRIWLLILMFLACSYSSVVLAADQGPINSGETRSSAIITPSTKDSWTFSGQAGDRVIINAVKTSGTFTPVVGLDPPGGGPQEANSGASHTIDHQLQNTGLYTIIIGDFSNGPRTGNYNLTFLKIPGTVSSTADPDGGPIASGQTLSGSINVPSDKDGFQFYGQMGERVLINAIKTSGTLSPNIGLYPPGGEAAEANSGALHTLDYQLQNTGLYTIIIGDFSNGPNTGEYNISFSKIPSTQIPGIYSPSPANGAALKSLYGTFVWDAVSGATGYDLYLGEGVTQPLQQVGVNLASPSLPFPALTRGRTYVWRVVAHTAQGDVQGPYCWFMITTKPGALPCMPLLLGQ